MTPQRRIKKSNLRQIRVCRNKKAYETSGDAATAVAFYLIGDGISLLAYKCDHCEKFHLTADNTFKETHDEN